LLQKLNHSIKSRKSSSEPFFLNSHIFFNEGVWETIELQNHLFLSTAGLHQIQNQNWIMVVCAVLLFSNYNHFWCHFWIENIGPSIKREWSLRKIQHLPWSTKTSGPSFGSVSISACLLTWRKILGTHRTLLLDNLQLHTCAIPHILCHWFAIYHYFGPAATCWKMDAGGNC